MTASGQISIIGGTGSYGAAVPGPAASSPLAIPQGMAIDGNGNLFVALYYGKQVVKITPSGTLSVVAGTGTAGTPVAGTATNSPLGSPYAVAVDPAGDLFIAGGNNDVEEVTPDGQLSVIAGNNTAGAPVYGSVASATSLATPKGIAVGANGRIYVTDTGNNTLDELTPLFPDTQTAPAITGTTIVGDALSSDNGTWSNVPTGFSYQWERCDSTGENCTAINGATSATYSLASVDVGSTLRTQVTARNAHGTQTAVSPASAVIQAATIAPPPTPTTTTTPATTTTTTSTPTPVPTATDVGPVNQIAPTIAGTPAIGQILEASVGGWTGPAVTYRYQWLRDGVPIPGATADNYRVSRADSGHKLSVEVVASDGTTSVAAASQTLTALAVDVRGCTAPSGRLTASAVGGVQLGMNRTSARRLVKSTQWLNGYTDNLCLAGGYGIRVGYANATMLGHGTLRSLSSRIVFATTANPYYTLNGARPGMTVASVTTRLHLARPITIGPNTWYVIPGTTTNHVLKTRGGVIQEIGVLNRALTHTREQQGRLLRRF